MHRRAFCLAAAAVSVAIVGCGTAGDAEYKDRIAVMNELADAMEKGESEAKVREIGDRLAAVEKKYTDLKLSDGEKKRLEAKYKDELDKAGQRIGQAIYKKAGKVLAPPVQPDVTPPDPGK